MSTSRITIILEPEADGSVRIPVPHEMRNKRVKVTATLEDLPLGDSAATGEDLRIHSSPEMIGQRLAAFARLRELNPWRDIDDPVEWQREIRKDRPLTGRD